MRSGLEGAGQRRLAKTAIVSVSEDLLIGQARLNQLVLNPFNWNAEGGWSSWSHSPPMPSHIVSTWEQYRALANSRGLRASAGAA
jgi:hypothetical protein